MIDNPCVWRSPAVVRESQNLKTLPVEVVLELLDEEAGNTDAEWLLWMGVRGMIANPAFAFPLIKVAPVTNQSRAQCLMWDVRSCMEQNRMLCNKYG